MTKKHPFFNYYNSTINQNTKGLKLVLGGTGLGKTSGIVDVVKYSETERKFIYCANRVQLLEEMAEKLRNTSIEYVHLKSDTDLLVDLLRKNEDGFYDLLEDKLIKKYVEYINYRTIYRLNIPEIIRACEAIKESGNINRSGLLGELVGRQVSQVMNFFKRILRDASDPDIQKSPQLSQKDHNYLLTHPIIKQIFPFIEYKQNPKVRVLLVTIQKAFYGFFDGQQNVSLTKLKGANGGNIVFLDEFDFLERELIGLICQDTDISEPFKFLQYFYEAMSKNKLPLPDYPKDEQVKESIESIIKIVTNLHEEKYKIDFPNINHFTCTNLQEIKASIRQPRLDKKKVSNPSISIFQTNQTVASRPFYLQETERAFDIVTEKTDIDAFTLLNAVNFATSRILYLFREIEAKNPIIRSEIMRHCFEATTFPDEIHRIRQLPPRTRKQATNFDKLLDTGFVLYEIQDLQQESDEYEVKLKHYSIYTTPERILRSLANHNLVFGLSATADIPRCIRNFSEEWLKKQEFPFYEIEEDDFQIIQAQNREKQLKRDNRITVLKAEGLEDKALIEFVEAVARDNEVFGNNNRYRRARLEHFFATLLWIVNNRNAEALKSDTHLLFFNSYKQIQFIFSEHVGKNEDGLFEIKPIVTENSRAKKIFQYYEIHIAGMDFIVIFYNAEQAKEIRKEDEVKEQFHQAFWQRKPVLLVTTYASAGNGINLQYYPDEESKMTDDQDGKKTGEKDFKNIHLLDSPFFYFGRIDSNNTEQENNAIIKQNIWYMAKLFTAKIVSQGKFRSFISNLRDKGLSNWYLNPSNTTRKDAVLNQLATFIQALGRIERVWAAMDDQTIRLRREVYDIFDTFCTNEHYEEIRKGRESVISNNLRQVFTQISEQAIARGKAIERHKEEHLAEINQQNKDSIRQLLEKLEAFRRGHLNSAKKDWLQLRQSALKHDFLCDKLDEYDCIFETPYYHRGKLYINSNLEIVPHTLWDSSFKAWQLDSLYTLISQNDIIRRYFEMKGYELGFNNTTNQFFTPYFYQAILAGAIGEEAIEAIFRKENIILDEDEIDDTLFELADTKIRGVPYYIDCKNYSEQTLQGVALTPDDPGWRPKLNDVDFKDSARKKLDKIRKFHADERDKCKLIYVNFMGTNERIKRYLDTDFTDLKNDFTAAKIIIIQGGIDWNKPDEYCQPFQIFLHHLHEDLRL